MAGGGEQTGGAHEQNLQTHLEQSEKLLRGSE